MCPMQDAAPYRTHYGIYTKCLEKDNENGIKAKEQAILIIRIVKTLI